MTPDLGKLLLFGVEEQMATSPVYWFGVGPIVETVIALVFGAGLFWVFKKLTVLYEELDEELQEIEEDLSDQHWLFVKAVKLHYFFNLVTHPFVISSIITGIEMDLRDKYRQWRGIYCDDCLHKKEMTAYDKRICRNCNPKPEESKNTLKERS